MAPDVVEADTVDEELEHRLLHIPEFGNRVLRVIVKRRQTPLGIVTVFFDRRKR